MSDSDKQSAVSALAACGEDIAQLEAAVSKYAWLEDHPGPHRQKWRLARGKVQRAKTPSKIVRVGAANAEAEEAVEEKSDGFQFEHGASGKTYDVDADFAKFTDENNKKEYFYNLKWRMKQMPGGASMKREEFYYLYGLEQQAKNGDNNTERPMWAERGGLDFEGRERWAQWERMKGMDAATAKKHFVEVYHEFDRKKALYAF